MLPDRELLLKLGLAEMSGRRTVPVMAGLLLVGKEPYLKQHVTEHEVIFLRHSGETEEYTQRANLKHPLLAVLETVSSNLEASNSIIPLQVGLYRYEIPRLHHKVYREAILNAVIHRSYGDYGSVYIRQYPDRLVITNPGGFLPGVGPHNLLSGNARPRNRRISEAFQYLGLVGRAGMGVPKMYRYQIETGKAIPEFEGGENHVKVIVSTEQIDQNIAAFVATQYRAHHKFDVTELLVLSRLRGVSETSAADIAKIAQKSAHETSVVLSNMIAKDLIRRRGNGPGSRYVYSPLVSEMLRQKVRTARETVIDSIRYPELIKEFIRNQGQITNADCRILCDLNEWQASRLLKKLTSEGILERRGPSPRMLFYTLRPSDA